jgi:Pentapeptide repeats (8 copies)
MAIGALAKLIGLGIKGWQAAESASFDEKDVAAIQGLLETSSSLASLRAKGTPTAAAQHTALVARSFGQAVGRHQEFHGKLLLTSGLRRWLGRSDGQRTEEIALRVKTAALRLQEMGNDPRGEIDFIRALTNPLDTPYYRRLWEAFSDPGMTLPGEEPPLEMSKTARREFERYFLLAYLTALDSPAGRGVSSYLESLKGYRTTLVRDLLLQDMASWGGRHIFGNVPRERWGEHDAVPFLPLDDLYVEAQGAIEQAGKIAEPEPLLELIERLAAQDDARKVVLVVADFGSGKSLSARMLARRLAESALESTSVSLDAVLPIYVKCSEDFPHEAVDLSTTARRAWKRQADSFGLSISDEDDALGWPGDGQRVVCLLDGLDEVSLGDQHLKTLFQKLQGRTTARQRFVVFSRPGAVPSRSDLGDGVSMVRVLPFEPAHIERWIAGWNGLLSTRRASHEHAPEASPVSLSAINALGIGELVRTPILLFMVAFTWERYGNQTQPPSLATIYEGFFSQIATGKAEADKERHGPISTAADAILTTLKNRGLVDERATQPDAMLWLMARVAWEAQKLEQRQPPEPLSRRHVDNLLHDELRLAADASHAIKIGLILALQSDLRSADHQILFGHQSFREFLIGRYWATQLHQIVHGNPREWDHRTRGLLGGRLLGDENKSFGFLMQIVNAEPDRRAASLFAWRDGDREALVRWAQDTFCDETQDFGGYDHSGRRDDTRLHVDMRAVLREAALAIGSMARGSSGLHGTNSRTLRSMLAWFWCQDLGVIVIAPGVDLTRADLANTILNGARLDKARLDGARFAFSGLRKAMLTGAQLSGADLYSAKLSEARLDYANLREATLFRANLVSADLEGACLDGADLAFADLRGAKLLNASLVGVSLTGAMYDAHTVWPDGFEPEARASFVE